MSAYPTGISCEFETGPSGCRGMAEGIPPHPDESMTAPAARCPLCDEPLEEVEAGLNRSWTNVLLTSFGSSELQIRTGGGRWWPFMRPNRNARGLYCAGCGALTLAPSIPAHRKELGLDG